MSTVCFELFLAGIGSQPKKIGAGLDLEAIIPGHHAVSHHVTQRKQHGRGQLWLGLHHATECLGGHEEQLAPGQGQYIGGALGLAEHGHLADEAAGLDRGEGGVLSCGDDPDASIAGEDHVQAVAGAAFFHDDATFLDLHHGAVADELLELRLAKPGQLVKLPELRDGDRVAGLAKFGWFGEWCLAGVVVGQRVASSRFYFFDELVCDMFLRVAFPIIGYTWIVDYDLAAPRSEK